MKSIKHSRINHAAIKRYRANGGAPKQTVTLSKNEMNRVRRGYAQGNTGHAHTTSHYAIGAGIAAEGKPLYDTMRERGYRWSSR